MLFAKKESYYVYLFRHGQTVYNEKGIFTGWHNPGLTKKGIEDAKKVAEKLKDKKFRVAFHTSLMRSEETLKEVLKFHPECKILIEDDRMIERRYGTLEGTSHDDFIKKIGRRLLRLDTEGDAYEDLSPALRLKLEILLGKEEFDVIHRGWDIPPPGGESFAMVEKRVASFVDYLKEFMRKNKCNVAISAHGNSIRLFRKIMGKSSKEDTVKWFIPYDDFYEYEVKV